MTRNKNKRNESVMIQQPEVKPEVKPEVIDLLVFPTNGWCEKLQCSYYTGSYQPKTKAEYDALKEFAEGSGK